MNGGIQRGTGDFRGVSTDGIPRSADLDAGSCCRSAFQPGASQGTPWDSPSCTESHSWDEYGEWHLALHDGAGDETKARYGFVFGDFQRVHRMGLIACQYRAAE